MIALIISLVSAAALVGIDQLIKYWASTQLVNVPTIPIIKDVFHLTYAENTGAAFSSFAGQKWLLVGVTSIMLVIILVFMIKRVITSPLAIVAETLILGGGIGNLIDRVFLGYVVDYLDFRLINFAIFNFADSCVVVGTILFMIYLLFFDKTLFRDEKK